MTSPDPQPQEPDPASERSPRPLPGALGFVALGTTVAGCVGVGVWLGILVDGRLHTSPAFLLVGLVLGAAAAVGTVVAQVRRFL
jgi:F0F1-type ATP synthase assembly protein I